MQRRHLKLSVLPSIFACPCVCVLFVFHGAPHSAPSPPAPFVFGLVRRTLCSAVKQLQCHAVPCDGSWRTAHPTASPFGLCQRCKAMQDRRVGVTCFSLVRGAAFRRGIVPVLCRCSTLFFVTLPPPPFPRLRNGDVDAVYPPCQGLPDIFSAARSSTHIKSTASDVV